jgi:2-phosphosulfolactate phosphatase
MTRARFVVLHDAAPADAVVVVDVLRAFTTAAWALHLGATRILAVDDAEHALALRARIDGSVAAGEHDGRQLPGFDLGNSPSALQDVDLRDRTLIHRTSAGTQGLARTAGSALVLAASFVNAGATARALRELGVGVGQVTFVITGASLGRDGDEDLACAELIAARLAGEEPDPAPMLARVATSTAGRMFTEGHDWAPEADLQLACQLDRFDFALRARPDDDLGAIEVGAR